MKNKVLLIILFLILCANITTFAQSSPAPAQSTNSGPTDPGGGGDPAIGTPLDSNAVFVLIFAGGLLLLLMNRKKVLEFVKSQK
jgi:hypothetical protein